ncbi:MAG TPA: hypothetical protein VHD32_01730 [Candidatus Didemnitutus sp.]|nr:hypothetical protein [Candidatus Didemnitutus sp.]
MAAPDSRSALAATSLVIALLASLALADRLSAASSIAGSWKGVYYTYPNVLKVELTLAPAANDTLGGTLKFSPSTEQRSGFNQPATGTYNVSGRYDPESRSFTLKPGSWVERPAMPSGLVPIDGVYDATDNRLAGVFMFPSAPNPELLVLVPADSGDAFVAGIVRSAFPPKPTGRAANVDRQRVQYQQQLDRMKALRESQANPAYDRVIETMQKRIDALPPPTEDTAGAPGWTPPGADQIVTWASRIKQEAPTMNLGSTVMEKIYLPARNLFADDFFKAQFGATFEELSPAQRHAFSTVFTQNGRQLQEYNFLMRPFGLTGDFGAPDITVSIHWQQAARAWDADVTAAMAAMTASADSFTFLSADEGAARTTLVYLWPSERKQFAEGLATARTRLAGPVLKIHADALIASAAGDSGAHQLAGWQASEKEILAHASPSDRAETQIRIDARLDALLTELLAAPLRALATLGHGAPAVLAGNAWYRQVTQRFDFAKTRQPVAEALREFRSIRDRSLAEARSAILAEIDAAPDEEAVKGVMSRYLACTGDEDSPAASAINQHAGQRVVAVKKEEMLARFSDYEKSLMSPPGSGYLDLSREDVRHIPQPDELRLALLRGMSFGTGQMLGPHKAKVSALFGAGSMIVTISDTRKGRYVFIPERHSWMVLYQVDMHFSLPDHDALWDVNPDFRRGAQLAIDATNATSALLSNEDNIEEFKLYPDGWGVPDLREQGAGKVGLEVMIRGMMDQDKVRQFKAH